MRYFHYCGVREKGNVRAVADGIFATNIDPAHLEFLAKVRETVAVQFTPPVPTTEVAITSLTLLRED